MTQMNLSTKQKQIHRYREQTCGCQCGRGGMGWESGISRCKLLHLEWINNKVLLYSTGNYIQYSVINHNGKEYEKMYICVTESLCCTVEINNNKITLKNSIRNQRGYITTDTIEIQRIIRDYCE